MRARARVVAEADQRGGTRLTTIRSQAPLLVRATPGAVFLVGGAAGPLGGDDLALEIDVGPGAALTLRTAAATLAFPGPSPSVVRVTARVAPGGVLRWLPEPLVAVAGCRHRTETAIRLCDGARLTWREELVLGRHGERGGSVSSRLTVDVGARPLLRHELALGPAHPAASSRAVTAGARAAGSLLVVDPRWTDVPPPPCAPGPAMAAMPLTGPGVHVVALAADASGLRRLLDAAGRELIGPVPAAPGP